jgi:hypothetical protein
LSFVLTFCHLGDWNSLIAMPICAYANGETQNPQFNHPGIEARQKNVSNTVSIDMNGLYALNEQQLSYVWEE